VKRTCLVLTAACSTFLIGCSQASSTWQPPASKGTSAVSAAVPARPVTPESLIANLESTRERAAYLRELSKDSSFEPKKHVEMLQKYTSDTDPEVASAAKELFDRAQ